MPDFHILLNLTLFLSLFFSFINGARDSGNEIATLISARITPPRVAIILCALMNMFGALLGTAVAITIAGELIQMNSILNCPNLALSALAGALAWHGITRYLGLPSSSFHSLIGGFCGAAVACGGWDALNYVTICRKVLLPLVFSPLGGFLLSFLLMTTLVRVCLEMHPRLGDHLFQKLQIASSGLMALTHGMNDAQKTMGMMVLALLAFQEIPTVEVSYWVRVACALAMALGTVYGGMKIVKIGRYRMFEMESVHGFASSISAATVTLIASLCGAPISTTHVFALTIVGVGSSKRLSTARWGIARKIIAVWILTIPAAAMMGTLFFYLLKIV